MKSFTCGVFLLTLSCNSFAESVTTRVLEVVPTKKNKETMVLIEAQERVIWLNSNDVQNLSALKTAQENELEVLINFEEKTGDFKSAQLLETKTDEEVVCELYNPTPTALDNYTPSILKNLNEANKLFNSMDANTKKRSQCFNRAHGWAYDMWKNYKVNSSKIFVFYTRRYIEEYRYKWWFHVAPYVHVQTEYGVEEFVLDRTFNSKPLRVKEWTDYFLRKTKPECPRVEKYSDYRQNQYAHDCYLILTSQYYRSPIELERLEKEGKQRLDWNYDLLKASRKQAFKNWREYYPN